MSNGWSRRTFHSTAGASLLPRSLFARLLAPASGDAAQKARLAEIDTVANRGPFTPSWESLEGFKVPQWYVDGKFGIFIHWGVYSVPGFGNEWYPRNMYKAGTDEFKHHVATYGLHGQGGHPLRDGARLAGVAADRDPLPGAPGRTGGFSGGERGSARPRGADPWEQTAEGLVVALPVAAPAPAPLSLRIAFSAAR